MNKSSAYEIVDYIPNASYWEHTTRVVPALATFLSLAGFLLTCMGMVFLSIVKSQVPASAFTIVDSYFVLFCISAGVGLLLWTLSFVSTVQTVRNTTRHAVLLITETVMVCACVGFFITNTVFAARTNAAWSAHFQTCQLTEPILRVFYCDHTSVGIKLLLTGNIIAAASGTILTIANIVTMLRMLKSDMDYRNKTVYERIDTRSRTSVA